MKKVDIIASLIIGVVSALIAMFILNFTQWEQFPIFGKYPLSMLLVFPAGSMALVFLASILGKKKPVFNQIGKNFLAGVLNTFIDLGLLNLLMSALGIFAGAYWTLLKALSFSVASINSYFWNKYWAFEKKETKPNKGEFIKLYTVAGIGFFLNVGISSFLVTIIGPQLGFSKEIWANLSTGGAVFIAFIWNFLGYKFIVFKK